MHTLKMKFLLSATHLPLGFQSLVAFPIKYVYRCMENIVSLLRVKETAKCRSTTIIKCKFNAMPAIRIARPNTLFVQVPWDIDFGPKVFTSRAAAES